MSSPNSNDFSYLKELGKSNYEIAQGESDIRGWVVKNEKGIILGYAKDLILDTNARIISYLVLDLEDNELNLRDRKVLLPIEYAEVHEPQKNVVYRNLTANELTALATYEKGIINRSALDQMNQIFSGWNNDLRVDLGSNPMNKNTPQPANQTFKAPESHIEAPFHTEYPDRLSRTDSHKDSMLTDSSPSQYKVIGVFNSIIQAPAAAASLEKEGFKKQDIMISNGTDVSPDGKSEQNEKSVQRFFRNIFGNEDDAQTYSKAALAGSVITVNAPSKNQAEDAAAILDQHGTKEIDIVKQTQQSDQINLVSRSRYTSSRSN